MNNTIDCQPLTIGRTVYTVKVVVGATADEIRAYLTGPRGATYGLLSNKLNPLLCFPVAEKIGRRLGGGLDGRWFKLIVNNDGAPTGVRVAS